MAEPQSSTFSGFFSRWGGQPAPGQKGGDAPAEPLPDAAELQKELRQAKEALQKASVEKALLKDLVDKAYGGDDDVPEEEAAASRKAMLDYQSEKAELQLRIGACEEAQQAAEKAAKAATKRAAVFEAEVTRLQGELKETDGTIAELRQALHDHDELVEQQRRTQAELEDARGTIEALMGKVSDADRVKVETERDLTAIVQKTAAATGDTQLELERKSELLATAQQEVARLKAAVARLESDWANTGAASAHAAEKEKELAAAAEEIERLQGVVAETEAKYEEACKECESLHTALDGEEAASATLRKDLDDAVAATKKLEAELETTRTKLVETQTQLGELKMDLQSGDEERAALQTSLEETRQELETAHEAREAAERELSAAADSLEAKSAEWAEERATLSQQVAELTDRVADAEANAEIKLRVANGRVKELQSQLAKASHDAAAAANSSGSDLSAADVAGNTLHDENLRLIERLASVQEQVWSLQTTKTTYEEEIKRLNQQLRDKSAVIRAHFEETARRMPAGAEKKKSGGFSIFSSSKDAEVLAAMQSQLEEALADKLQLHQANAQLRGELNNALEAIDRAVLMGFDPDADVDPDDASPAAAAPSGHSVTPRQGGMTPRRLSISAAGHSNTNAPSHLDDSDGFDD